MMHTVQRGSLKYNSRRNQSPHSHTQMPYRVIQFACVSWLTANNEFYQSHRYLKYSIRIVGGRILSQMVYRPFVESCTLSYILFYIRHKFRNGIRRKIYLFADILIFLNRLLFRLFWYLLPSFSRKFSSVCLYVSYLVIIFLDFPLSYYFLRCQISFSSSWT